MPAPAFDPRGLKAVVFDIDGTLYRQGPLRRAMLLRLLAAHALRPIAGWRTFAALRAYRHAQEHLRGDATGDVAAAQVNLACERARMDRATVAETVERWMEREPLAILKRHLQPGLIEFLDICRSRGLRLATLSDYPGNEKLRALGVSDYFEVSLCAQAKEIGVFKPNPKGLRVALERLGASPRETLYVGDRPEVDALAADAAGMPCVIVTRSRASSGNSSYMQARSYFELSGLLFGSDGMSRA